MPLIVKVLDILSGKRAVILNKADARSLGIELHDRIKIIHENKTSTAIVEISEDPKLVPTGKIALYKEIALEMGAMDGETVEISLAKTPMSVMYIRKKLKGQVLLPEEITSIVQDAVALNLSELETTAFLLAQEFHGMNMDEIEALTKGMVKAGRVLELPGKVVDKHCLPKHIPIMVRMNGEIMIENIGKVIDDIFKKHSSFSTKSDGDCEYLNDNLEHLEVLTYNDDGKVEFVPVSGMFRVDSPGFLEEIELVGHRKIQSTLDHTIFILKRGKILNIPAKEARIGDYVVVPTGFPSDETIGSISFEKFRMKGRNYLNFPSRITITPEFMRLLGYYVSEGFTNYQGVFFNFGSHEKRLIDDCIECVKLVFRFTPTINYPHSTATRICLYSRVLSKMFNQIVKAGKDSSNKRIPRFLFNVSREMKLEFLRALFHGDGYERRGYEEIYVTVSKKLVTDLQYLLSLMDISSTFSVKKRGVRNFLSRDGTIHPTKTKQSYLIYTQAREIFGNRLKANVAFINLLPIKELGEVDTSQIGWELRKDFKRNKYITKEKLLKIIDKVKSEDVKKFVQGHLSVSRIKRRRLVKSRSKYIYDFKVEGYNRFIAGTGPICIHNSIGGVPGNKVSLLIVPIIASTGLLIPKTSSRAITSPSGTMDTMSVLANVQFSVEEFRKMVIKVGGAIVWGGALNLAPADDIFIRVEQPLKIDPRSQMLASIMAKKAAEGISYLVVDLPTGKGAKVETVEQAHSLASDFIELGNRLGITVKCGVTYGGQPIGRAVGPALEAIEALSALEHPQEASMSLVGKSTALAGLLLEITGYARKGEGESLAMGILMSGKALEKFKEIIEAQGGDPNVKPEGIPIGKYSHQITSETDGYVTLVDNDVIKNIARAAGAPIEKGSGILILAKQGYKVEKGQVLMEIIAERSTKLQEAVAISNYTKPIIVESMLLSTIPEY